jgi:hypothetical protein
MPKVDKYILRGPHDERLEFDTAEQARTWLADAASGLAQLEAATADA